MTKPKDEQPASPVNEPPDELFEWIESPRASLKSTKDSTSLTSPLRTLKTIIWSIDWEISDQILMMLNEELNQLKEYYQEDETILKFLQLMEAVGRYIKKRKGRSHPESVGLLREFFVELERIIFMIGMPEGERKTSLQKQIEKFNILKKKLAASRTADPPAEKPAPEKIPPEMKKAPKKTAPEMKKAPQKTPPEIQTPPAVTKDQILPEFNPGVFREIMVEEMRLVIRYEFKKIKAELLKEILDIQRS